MRKILVVLVAATLAVGLLAACSEGDPEGADDPASTTAAAGSSGESGGSSTGDGEGDDPPAPPSTPGEIRELDLWAAEFCAGFNLWIGALQASTEGVDVSISPTDYPAQQRTLVTFFDGQAAAASAMVERIEAGSVPDIEGGRALVDELIDLFTSVAEAAEDARTAMAALGPAAASFEVAGQEIVTGYQEALGAAGERFANLGEEYPELAEETSFEEDCVT